MTISRSCDAPLDDMWRARTDPGRIPRWCRAGSSRSRAGRGRAGGRCQLEGNAGGVIEHCDPPGSFAGTGAPVDVQEFMARAGSEEGRRFMTASSRARCVAHVASGEDETAAREATDRTTATCTGTGEGGGGCTRPEDADQRRRGGR
ncbi:hypothetical protein [Streptomyces spiralis]|uniref:hypothetical protein n=1 Tax=Streptomyces spiralis TaxID=66376 RepID=UPI0036AB9F2B